MGAEAERLRAYADVDAFADAIASDDETRDGASVVVPVLFALTGREREARARARLVPGDFGERLERWLAGERPPPPPEWESPKFDWRAALRQAFRETREKRRPFKRSGGADQPRASWRDVWDMMRDLGRIGRSLEHLSDDEWPPSAMLPDRDRPWTAVELEPGAEAILQQAVERSPLPVLMGVLIEAHLEPDRTGRLRVIVDGTEVGTVPAHERTDSATVPGRIQRGLRKSPASLLVQLPDRQSA